MLGLKSAMAARACDDICTCTYSDDDADFLNTKPAWELAADRGHYDAHMNEGPAQRPSTQKKKLVK